MRTQSVAALLLTLIFSLLFTPILAYPSPINTPKQDYIARWKQIQQYLAERMSYSEIARIYGVHPDWVRKCAAAHTDEVKKRCS